MKIFTRIFLSFWLTVIVVIGMTILLIVPFSLMQSNHPLILPKFPMNACALATLDEYERGGRDALAQYLTTSRSNGSCSSGILALRKHRQFWDSELKLASVESSSGSQVPADARVAVRELPLHAVIAFPQKFGSVEPTLFLVMRLPFVLVVNSPLPPQKLLVFLLSRMMLVALVSGLCCYVLTLHLVKPVIRLGQMAEQLGGGNLGTRIERPLIARKDELGEFGRKFNQMAGEIESLVTRYKHFLAHASHELGSPLTRVNIALGLARKKVGPGLQPELDRIGHETKRLNTLVQEMLLLARLESGNELSRQTTSFDAALMIEEACADASFEAAQLGKSVVFQRKDTFQIAGHRDLLRRAVDNVLRNGLRFARENGSVCVELSHDKKRNKGIVTIQDDGPGVAAEQEELIFEPFVTLQNSAIGSNEGSGLGLAIARQAVIVNGGRIFARGSTWGGLTVTVELPVTVLQS